MGVFPQVGRQQDAALLVRFHGNGVAEKVPLDAAAPAHRQLVDPLFQLVPFFGGVDGDAFIQPDGENEGFPQLFPETRGKIDPVFGIDAVLVLSHQHNGSFPPFRLKQAAKQG